MTRGKTAYNSKMKRTITTISCKAWHKSTHLKIEGNKVWIKKK